MAEIDEKLEEIKTQLNRLGTCILTLSEQINRLIIAIEDLAKK